VKLPYFKHLYYLSGIDWIISGIDSFMLRTSPAGNHSTLIIELKNRCDKLLLEEKLADLVSKIPLLNATLKRDVFNLAPYWKINNTTLTPVVDCVECSNIEEFEKVKERVLNKNFRSKRDHLAFLILSGEMGNYLFMTFDHKFFDAKGAEQFIQLLTKSSNETKISEIKKRNSPKLKNWSMKFAAGKDVQRHLIEQSKKRYTHFSNITIDKIKAVKGGNLKSITTVFSREESEAILKRSEEKAGFMMETPYFLATIIKSVENVLNITGEREYSIPMPIDTRDNSKGSFSQMLFNHLSFMFLDISLNEKMNFNDIICEIRKKIFYNIENELPDKLIKATRLSRIAPLFLFKKFMKLPNNGQVASFAFANLGGSSKANGNVLSNNIIHISHMPRLPSPPGIGFFFNQYGGKIQYTITWDKNILENDIIDKINSEIKKF
jgi:hypothetical protein